MSKIPRLLLSLVFLYGCKAPASTTTITAGDLGIIGTNPDVVVRMTDPL